MKENRSLAISSKIQACRIGLTISVLEDEFPVHIFENNETDKKTRDRIFNIPNTLLTMVLTSFQEDKTLQNSVDLYYGIHQKKQVLAQQEATKEMELLKQSDLATGVIKAGRPKKYGVKLSKSLSKNISLNTAAYSKARDRVPMHLVENLFRNCRIQDAENSYTYWHGYKVLIGDGTYIQMQDSHSIREKYEVKHNGEAKGGYPQALLEVLIERGTGQISNYTVSNRHTSELELFYEMLDKVPKGTLLLLDDLYNCYEIIAKCIRLGIEIVVPAKRERNTTLLETWAEFDEVVKIKVPKKRSVWNNNPEKAEELIVRMLKCKSEEGKEYELLTTIIDKKIPKEDFQCVYLTRWDIEICIREIKTIMDINVLRSQTPEMALKELGVSLSSYNLIRKMIYASTKDLLFSPKEDFIYQFYTNHKELLIDKKGRIYNKWSTGRRRTQITNTKANTAKTKA
jgi:hypothetical protein